MSFHNCFEKLKPSLVGYNRSYQALEFYGYHHQHERVAQQGHHAGLPVVGPPAHSYRIQRPGLKDARSAHSHFSTSDRVRTVPLK